MSNDALVVAIDTSPLDSGHAARGIGTYTRLLTQELEKLPDLTVIRSATQSAQDKIATDVTHYPFFDLFFNTLPLNIGKKIVVTIHDVIPLKFPNYYKSGVRGSFRLQQQKLALKTVSAVITDSESSKKDIVELLGVSGELVQVVYLAANEQLQAQPKKIIKKVKNKYSLPENYVLYVGDINYNKNLPQLIKSIKFLPEEVSLVCLGKNFVEQDIPEWQWIETQLELSEVRERVHFLSDVNTDEHEDLAAIYSGAQCYIQPSLYEGFGLPLLEAMQCKTPVVAAKNSSLIEIGSDQVVYCEPVAESIAASVKEVLSWSAAKRKQVLSEAYAWSQTFSWKKTAKETAAVYKRVAS